MAETLSSQVVVHFELNLRFSGRRKPLQLSTAEHSAIINLNWMIDNAKINALIQKYGKVAAGRKVNYQPVRLEQHELLSTYRTEEDRLLTGRTEAPIADSFKKRKPISHVPKATQLGSTHIHLKKPVAHEVPQLQTSDIRMKADKKHATDVQTSRPTVTTKTAKPVKKKSAVAPVKKDR